MNNYPNVFTLEGLKEIASSTFTEINGKYVPARPEGFVSIHHRIHCAWLVFTGKADAIIWPEGQ